MSTVCLINSSGAIHEHPNIYSSSIEDHVSRNIGNSYFKHEISHSSGFTMVIYYKDDTTFTINNLAKYILPQKEIRGSILVAIFDSQDKLINCDKKQLFFIYPALKWEEYKVCIVS